jgi:predicted RecB family nuclease
MQQGQEVGELARSLFSGGVVASSDDWRRHQDDAACLFEARFESDGFIARADVLVRLADGWHVVEVKSSFADTKSFDELVDDLAYTVMVAWKSVAVTRASLLLLSRNYQYGDPPTSLFEEVDASKQAFLRAAEFQQDAEQIHKALSDAAPPAARLKSACRQCAWFADQCLGRDVEHSVLELPNLHRSKLETLATQSVVSLSKLPADFALTDTQARVRDAVLTRRPVVSKESLRDALESVEWPCHYLDFETVATVLPLFPGMRCHEQVLTQFSVHHRETFERECTHDEYLAEETRECQRELAEALIRALGTSGSVVVYSHFEKQRLRGLAGRFTELRPALAAIEDRLVDLLPIVRSNLYHPAFKGSYSIKSVLPVLVPELSYEDLEIGGGDTAITRFARLVRREILDDRVAEARASLLAYCKRDTEAMVRLHEALGAMAASDDE